MKKESIFFISKPRSPTSLCHVMERSIPLEQLNRPAVGVVIGAPIPKEPRQNKRRGEGGEGEPTKLNHSGFFRHAQPKNNQTLLNLMFLVFGRRSNKVAGGILTQPRVFLCVRARTANNKENVNLMFLVFPTGPKHCAVAGGILVQPHERASECNASACLFSLV